MTVSDLASSAGAVVNDENRSHRFSAMEHVKKRLYLIVALLSPIGILTAWYIVTAFKLVSPIILPGPGAVLAAFAAMLANGYSGGSFLSHLWASLSRLLVAYGFAVLLGVPIGLLRGRYRLIDAVLLVPAEVLRPIPPLGIIPLLILWFGIGELSKVVVIWICAFLIIMLNTQAGVRSVQPDAIRAAQSLGASPFQVFRYVILPSALPQIMTGLRVSLGAGLTILVAAELLGGDRGLGFIILDASNFFRTKDVFVGIAMIGLLGLLSDRGLNWISRHFVHWDGKR
jgi:NitT/TauT family transport system permease protein/taurine transport system permease protein